MFHGAKRSIANIRATCSQRLRSYNLCAVQLFAQKQANNCTNHPFCATVAVKTNQQLHTHPVFEASRRLVIILNIAKKGHDQSIQSCPFSKLKHIYYFSISGDSNPSSPQKKLMHLSAASKSPMLSILMTTSSFMNVPTATQPLADS